MKRTFIYLYLILLILSACREECSDLYTSNPLTRSLSIVYQDAKGNFLVNSADSTYQAKNIKVTDQKGGTIDYTIDLTSFAESSEPQFYCLNIQAFGYEEDKACKQILIKLSADIDTLNYCYKVDKCKEAFEYLRLEYNGKKVDTELDSRIQGHVLRVVK
ncbi:MAG: hypothetical protein H7Y07_01635 [Pyrinomonadaceae bacterium]|nr:hypothetical protein [Sphingobacteriaceae bacterium]